MDKLLGGNSGGQPEMVEFSWRNVAVFLAALLVTSSLMLGGVIIAVDRLVHYTDADEQSAMVERPRQSWPDSQFRTPRLPQRNE
jgi:hypothetical protein